MTDKLYERDSHLKSCRARVRACESAEDGFDILLDRTAFFPEAGGQPSDTGRLGPRRMLRAREAAGGEVLHRADGPLPAGESVELELDWARRFDFMQQHSGEHLLSFAFHSLYGANNVGFHLAEADYATIDFDLPLSPEQRRRAEAFANELVWRCLPIRAETYESPEALERAGVTLRKQAGGLEPPIRVVTVEGADRCTCCAPHCKSSGEIGLIFITDAMAYKGGTRIFFVCGGRALKHLAAAHDALDGLARRFSCAREQASAAVEKLQNEFAASRRRERTLGAALNGYRAAELRAAAEPLRRGSLMLRLYDGLEAAELKALAQDAAGGEDFCVLLSRNAGRLAYAVATPPGFSPDAGELIQAVNAATGGKGGGRNGFAQGMAPSDAGAQETLEQLRSYFFRRFA
ncbi:MAG: alanyl-tRNA editing protein [Clostridia bacterium]|nr:alanyl-tRNA editing protein [Clostridia bacterium]